MFNIENKKIEVYKIADELNISSNEILTYRPEGKKIKEYLIKNIRNNLLINLDFSKIRICDVSVIDEIVFELIMFIRKEKLNILFILSNVDEYVYESIRAAQLLKEDKLSKELGEKFRIPLLYLDNKNSIKVLGDLETILYETFELITEKNIITARDISIVNKIAINSASNRLKKLYDYKLVFRKTVTDDSGKYYEYLLPVIKKNL